MTAQKQTKRTMISRLLVFLVLAAFASAQLEGTGDCNGIPTTIEPNFNFTLFVDTGSWFVQQTYDTTGKKCNKHSLNENINGDVIVRTDFVTGTGQINIVTGNATLVDTSGYAIFDVNYGIPGIKRYWVLGTDYETFVVIWGCVQGQDNKNIQTLETITKSYSPTTDVLYASQAVLNMNPNINSGKAVFRPVNQFACSVPALDD